MLPDRVSNKGPLTYESGALPIALRGPAMRLCWVNFQYRGVLLIWLKVGQGPTALAVDAGGGCLGIFTLIGDGPI